MAISLPCMIIDRRDITIILHFKDFLKQYLESKFYYRKYLQRYRDRNNKMGRQRMLKHHYGMTVEQYQKSTAPTINHFHEKLLLLKDRMNTETGRKMAEQRHHFMEQYLEQFFKEWNENES